MEKAYLLVECLGRGVLVFCNYRCTACGLGLVNVRDAEGAVVHDVIACRHRVVRVGDGGDGGNTLE